MRSPIVLPASRNEVHDALRKPGFRQQVHEPRGHDRRIARRFEDDRISGDHRGGGHAGHDRAGKVPWRNDRPDAQRDIDHFVLLAVERHDRMRTGVAQRFARIKLQEVDGFGDIPVGFGPALADFVDQQGVVLETPFAQQCRRLEDQLGALLRRRALPRFERAAGRLDRLGCLLLRRRAGEPDRLGRVGRIERADFFLGFDLLPVNDERIVLSETCASPIRAPRASRRHPPERRNP